MIGKRTRHWGAGVTAGAMMASPLAATAQAVPSAPPLAEPLAQTPDEAWAQDGALYARRFGIGQDEAARRLRALHASAAFTDRIRATFHDRLAGVSIEHSPVLRIVVLLTGGAPVTATSIMVEGVALPVEFRTGAPASAEQVVRAMIERGPELSRLLPGSRGMGQDPRTGELVILVAGADAVRSDLAAVRARAEALTNVKIRFERIDGPIANLSLAGTPSLKGGGRLVGVDPADGKRYACTSGFAVSDGMRSGLTTAAHCPDAVDFQQPGGAAIPLTFVGQWGVSTQDVQIHVPASARQAPQPLFYADRKSGALRKLAGARSRMSTRAGEWVCRYGEGSGYSCAEVVMIHFAPPAPLCAGVCAPSWVMVRTNDCRSGDSGGPVFSGPIAFGLNKGGSRVGDRCNLYFYMSTDFLPAGWRLLR